MAIFMYEFMYGCTMHLVNIPLVLTPLYLQWTPLHSMEEQEVTWIDHSLAGLKKVS